MAFIVPTTFTVNGNMPGALSALNLGMNQLNASAARLSNTFGGMNLFKGLLAGGAGAYIGKTLMEYENAVSDFRVIVSDLNDVEFSRYEKQIGAVAMATKKSSAEVANSFEKIAGLNESFAKTAEGLGAASQAAITLSKATPGMTMADAAEAMVVSMNQFNLSADQSMRTVNALAAGQARGAANIAQEVESMKVFGATAASANMSLEQTIGLIQTIAQKGILGSVAGTQLTSFVTSLQKAKIGYVNGTFDINAAISMLQSRLKSFGSEIQRNNYIQQVFGETGKNVALQIQRNGNLFADFTQKVTGTNEAIRAADIRSNTLSNRISELVNGFGNLLTSEKSATGAMGFFSNSVRFLTDNLEGIMNVIVPLGAAMLTYKGLVWASALVMRAAIPISEAYAFTQGLVAVATGKLNGNLLAFPAYARGAQLSMSLLNMGALGWAATLGIVGVSLAALTALLFRHKLTAEDLNTVNRKTKDGFLELNKAMSADKAKQSLYNSAVARYNENQDKLQVVEQIIEFHKRKGTRGSFAQLFDMLPYFDVVSDMAPPKKSDYGISEDIINRGAGSQNVNHHFTIDLTQGGKVIKSIDSASLIPSLSSTSSYSDGR